MKAKGILSILSLSATVVLAGCYGVKEYEPNAGGRTIFLPSVRHVGPEPVYSRTRWVQLPEVVPVRSIPGEDDNDTIGVRVRPVYHATFKDATLEEASRILAATSRYTSYCAPSIAGNKVSVDNLGTIDELGGIIAQAADITVVIDHPNREVRFLAASTHEPQLFGDSSSPATANEY